MKNTNKPTQKQLKTLMLFAQNYSLQVIANKQRVSISTIRHRLRKLETKYPDIFKNVLDLRRIYKQNKGKIQNVNLPSYFCDTPSIEQSKWDNAVDLIKEKF